MCGINGFNFVDQEQIVLMNRSIKHRGPNDEGIFIDNNVSLGHVRLSITDLSKAVKQPMIYKYKNKKAIIVFNGEIYNHLEIKKELEKKGYKFKSRTDTEVVLASYLEWGYDCVKYFNGMWAFVIYDPEKRLLFCSRDRFGQKPLYYFFNKKIFIFSSELKGILTHQNLSLNIKKNINKDSINLYFSLGFIPSPYSIYKDTYKLEARQNLIFSLPTKEVKKWYYYEIPKYKPVKNIEKLIEEGRELLKDSVRLRLIADIPVGALLSGGLDSSAIVGFVKELKNINDLHTFSIGFEGEYDETTFANIVKEHVGTIHHHYYFRERDFKELIDTYAYIYDEPFADFSGFPTYKVCKIARKHVSVVLSGDGGDEIFGGYIDYMNGIRMDLIRKIPKIFRIIGSKIPARRNLNKNASLFLLKEAFKLSLHDPALFHAKALESERIIPEIFKKWTTEKLKFCIQQNGDSLAEGLRLYDLLYNTTSDNFLVKVDRASMANNIEVRSPFLDHRFIEFSQKIPTKWKVDLFHTKKLLKEISRGILPNKIINRRKQAFIPPLQNWIQEKEYEPFLRYSLQVLKELDTKLYHFFNEKALKENNKLYGLYKIRLFLFGKWMERWIK